MPKRIFEFTDYKTFLKSKAQSSGHGFKTAFAHAAHCQITYFSKVLRGNAHLSLEQAHAASGFLGLSPSECAYFLLLVERARAGTTLLQDFLDSRIIEERKRSLLIENRVSSQPLSLSPEAVLQFHSSWEYGAVRCALDISSCRTVGRISTRLRISPSRVAEILDFLVSIGLVKQDGKRFSLATQSIILQKSAPKAAHLQYQANWLIRALESIPKLSPGSYHYTGVYSLSRKDRERIRRVLIDAIETCARPENQISLKGEDLMAITIHYFDV